MARTRRRSYTGSKAVDGSCRSHGSCPWCQNTRKHKVKKRMSYGLDGAEAILEASESNEGSTPS